MRSDQQATSQPNAQSQTALLIRRKARPFGLCLLFALTACLGCGDQHPFRRVPISGKVAYEDGSAIPAPRMRMQFFPQVPPTQGNEYPRPANATINPLDGSFTEATTHAFGDGVIPGKIKVTVVALDKNEQVLPLVARDYAQVATTPLEITVPESGAREPLLLKIAKP